MAGELKAAFVPFTELKFPLESTPQGLALVREREATIRRIDQQHKHSTLPARAQTASAASSRGDASARAIAAELRSARFGAYPDLEVVHYEDGTRQKQIWLRTHELHLLRQVHDFYRVLQFEGGSGEFGDELDMQGYGSHGWKWALSEIEYEL